MRWVACKGKGRLVVGGVIALCCVRNERRQLGGAIFVIRCCSGVSLTRTGWTLLIKGTPPGVLFWVNLRWIRGVFFRTLFAVGFHACIIRGASIILGTVRMGVSSITFCSSSLTLCSTCGVFAKAGGWRMSLIFDRRSLMSRLPLLVALAIAVDLANLLVSVQKCWCRVMFGIWQCWGESFCGTRDSICPSLGNVVHLTSVVIHQRAQVPSVDTLQCPWSSGVAIFVDNRFASQRGEGILVPIIWFVECFISRDSWVYPWSLHQIKCVLYFRGGFVP